MAAGGYLLQAMPGADEAALDRLASHVERAPSPSDLVRSAQGPVEILDVLFAGVAHRVVGGPDEDL